MIIFTVEIRDKQGRDKVVPPKFNYQAAKVVADRAVNEEAQSAKIYGRGERLCYDNGIELN